MDWRDLPDRSTCQDVSQGSRGRVLYMQLHDEVEQGGHKHVLCERLLRNTLRVDSRREPGRMGKRGKQLFTEIHDDVGCSKDWYGVWQSLDQGQPSSFHWKGLLDGQNRRNSAEHLPRRLSHTATHLSCHGCPTTRPCLDAFSLDRAGGQSLQMKNPLRFLHWQCLHPFMQLVGFYLCCVCADFALEFVDIGCIVAQFHCAARTTGAVWDAGGRGTMLKVVMEDLLLP